ncbi:hypothetical protein Hanom_Chr09g00843651 [Helianthus anomalus]
MRGTNSVTCLPISDGAAIKAVTKREGLFPVAAHRRESEEREGPCPINDFLYFSLFFFNKKPIHLRGECRHQFRVLGEFKRGFDVAHEDWLGVREGTHLLGEHPLHPNIV